MGKGSLEEVLEELGTDLERGLSEEEVRRRLEKYGPNELPEKKVHPLIKFLSYFWGPIPWMIEAAAILSFISHDMEDFIIIVLLLLLNAVVEFWQEHKAENVIEYLRRKMAVKARVLRDGEWRLVDARELVPGDVVRIRLGDIVPADVVIAEDVEISVDESALTGESLPVTKGKGDVIYSGSIVKRGEALAVVVKTGMNTYFGRAVQLVSKAETTSELQKAILKIGNFLILTALVLTALIFAVGVFIQGHPWTYMLKYVLVLTVASIPAALPAVLTITMAIGAMELARKQAVVTKLVSIEELAGVDVLLSDKTGTLTKNKLEVGKVTPMGGYTERDVIFYAALASREEDKDPIDTAILEKAKEMGLEGELRKWRQVEFVPFDPTIKRTEATVTDGKVVFRVMKGAPQVILDLAEAPSHVRAFVEKTVEEMAQNGFRAIVVAVQRGDYPEVVGVIPLYDPPREDAKEAVSLIQRMGVAVKMITGDHEAIARFIARVLGIGDRIRTVEEIEKLPEEEKAKVIEETDAFARALPEHKFMLVSSLQERGHLVAMTGDGVNDAPALKKANCGIAVANATDAARAAASIVLLEPGIRVIADAIQVARKIFQRMESYVIYRITETIRVLIFMALSILVFGFYPVTATMIILLALLNDVPILMIAYDNVEVPKRPARWKPKKTFLLSLAIGISGVISSFLLLGLALWWYATTHGVTLPELLSEIIHAGPNNAAGSAALAFIQTLIFLKLVVAGHSTLFITRSRRWFWQRPWPSRRLLSAILITDIIGTILAALGILMAPIGWKVALFVWAYAIAWMFINDAVKQYVGRKLGLDVEEEVTG